MDSPSREVSPEVLSVLVCPRDHAALRYEKESSSFSCTLCERVYSIQGGVPNFLVAK